MKIFKLFLLVLPASITSLQINADTTDLPYYLDGGLKPEWAEQLDGREIHTVGGFELENQLGQSVSADDYSGKIRVVNFFFATCPGVCPTSMRNLKKVEQSIDSHQSVMLSFSITPNIDTPERLAEYALERDIHADEWQLMTGNSEQITDLARKSFFAVLERNVSQNAFVHTEKAFLVDRQGHIRGVYNATSPADVMRLVEDLQLLSSATPSSSRRRFDHQQAKEL